MAKEFWQKVHRSKDEDACWEWQRCCNDSGYGIIRVNGRNERAHRVAFVLTHGPIPDGKHILHSCHNPPCCNPKHLKIGTDLDNFKDRIDCGTAVPPPIHIGSANPSARLTESEVIEIRASGLSVTDLATKYGVRRGTINFILKGQTWRHLLNA